MSKKRKRKVARKPALPNPRLLLAEELDDTAFIMSGSAELLNKHSATCSESSLADNLRFYAEQTRIIANDLRARTPQKP